jgi:hypothetical protein
VKYPLFRHNVLLSVQSFSVWEHTYHYHNTHEIPTWLSPTPIPSGFTHLEKFIFLSLWCLADDTSAMALHTAFHMVRQTEKREEILLTMAYSDMGSWTASRLLTDCLIWLSFVICAPYNLRAGADDTQKEPFRALLLAVVLERGPLAWDDAKRVLRRFFYDERRAHVWEETWKGYIAGYRVPQTLG